MYVIHLAKNSLLNGKNDDLSYKKRGDFAHYFSNKSSTSTSHVAYINEKNQCLFKVRETHENRKYSKKQK